MNSFIVFWDRLDIVIPTNFPLLFTLQNCWLSTNMDLSSDFSCSGCEWCIVHFGKGLIRDVTLVTKEGNRIGHKNRFSYNWVHSVLVGYVRGKYKSITPRSASCSRVTHAFDLIKRPTSFSEGFARLHFGFSNRCFCEASVCCWNFCAIFLLI